MSSSSSSSVADLPNNLCQETTVCVSAGETLALLMHAARTNRAWLSDFTDETIQVSQDLYEVLVAYRRVAQSENARAA